MELSLIHIYQQRLGRCGRAELAGFTARGCRQLVQQSVCLLYTSGTLCLPRRIAGSEKQTVRHVFNGDGYRHLPDAAQRLLYGVQKR